MNKIKYPRTSHVPWSRTITSDDIIAHNLSFLFDKNIVITEKMDGENTTLYNDHIHARSLDSGPHPSRTWVRNFWGNIKSDIPEEFRICGENLFAKHSIFYENLESYFLGFSIWNEENYCLDWKTTKEFFALLNIISVPVLYEGPYNKNIIDQLTNTTNWEEHEGYVIRFADQFHYDDFSKCVFKYVRMNHVRSDEHWMHSELKENKLREKC